MLLISCKVELKLKRMKYFVLSAAANDNVNGNNDDNNIIFTIKDIKIICPCCNFISKQQSKIIKTSEQRI